MLSILLLFLERLLLWVFSTLEHLSFFKTKQVSNNTKVCYTTIFKTISCVCSKNNGEGHVEKSFISIAGLLVRFPTLPSGSD